MPIGVAYPAFGDASVQTPVPVRSDCSFVAVHVCVATCPFPGSGEHTHQLIEASLSMTVDSWMRA